MTSKSLINGQYGEEDNITVVPPLHTSSQNDGLLTTPDCYKRSSSSSYSDEKRKPPTEPLHRQGYIILLVLIYAAIFIASWSILVMTSKHPIGRKSYNCFDNQGQCVFSSATLERQNLRTSWYIKKAQTLLATVSLLTIPLTSAVCAAAVVPWLQQSGQGMSLRQIITLSDKGWTSPYIYYRLLAPTGWKRYGSSFISLALLLHALGAALSPAISQLSAVVNIKVPASSPTVTSVNNLMNMQDLLHQGNTLVPDDEATILKLRNLLKAPNLNQIQAELWVPHNESCIGPKDWNPGLASFRSRCDTGGFLTYLNVADETEVWQSQLSNGFATGIKSKQYLPRVNSSVSIELIDRMPPSCTPVNAALLLSYAGTSTSISTEFGDFRQYDWSVQACVPEYPTTSMYNETDNAQTFIETAYLDLYTFNSMGRGLHNITKITMSTTVGYFELPNYSNGNVPGPLLKEFSLPPPSDPYGKRRRHQLDIPQMPSYELTLQENATNAVPGIANLELLPRKALCSILYTRFLVTALCRQYT